MYQASKSAQFIFSLYQSTARYTLARSVTSGPDPLLFGSSWSQLLFYTLDKSKWGYPSHVYLGQLREGYVMLTKTTTVVLRSPHNCQETGTYCRITFQFLISMRRLCFILQKDSSAVYTPILGSSTCITSECHLKELIPKWCRYYYYNFCNL